MSIKKHLKDYTKDYKNYEELIEEEKEHYSQIEVTERLTEGGVHAHSSWEYYWQNVGAKMHDEAPDFVDISGYIKKSMEQFPVRILSLGSGYCGQEIGLAERLSVDYEIVCVDINEALFSRAYEIAEERNLNIRFLVEDINFIQLESNHYDVIMIHAALHHVINLELLFEQISQSLTEQGFFHIVEVVGENRKLIWDENEVLANKLLDLLPPPIIGSTRLKTLPEEEGMEGVRQEDILPLLEDWFDPLYEHKHGAFMRFICTHPTLGSALNPADAKIRSWLDFLIDCDQSSVKHGLLRPLEIWGCYKPKIR